MFCVCRDGDVYVGLLRGFDGIRGFIPRLVLRVECGSISDGVGEFITVQC